MEKKLNAKHWTKACLKDLCQFLELDRSGSPGELITRIAKFLVKPKDAGNASIKDMSVTDRMKATGKRKSSSSSRSSKTRKGGKDGKKRKLNGYMTFGNEMRSEIMEENPDMAITGVAKELGRLWREMSDEEKKVYNDKAQAKFDLENKEEGADAEEAGDDDAEEEAAEEEAAEEEAAEKEAAEEDEVAEEEAAGEKVEEKTEEAEVKEATEEKADAAEEEGEAEFEG
jgi:hypothetical protein